MQIALPPFQQARVLIVGDIIWDRYWSGSSHRISPEAPVPIVNIQEKVSRPGGAANVAVNTATLGVHTRLVGLAGLDKAADELKLALQAAKVDHQIITASHYQTLVKLRVLSHQQQLLRLDFEQPFQPNDSTRMVSHIQQQQLLNAVDLLVLSDYGKGTLSEVASIIQLARTAGIPILIDPKGTDFSRYRGATLLTPNQMEFEAVVGHCADDSILVERGMQLLTAYDIGALLITRSERGMMLLCQQSPPLPISTQAQSVFDVTGAGDTVIATIAAAMAAGTPLKQACELANVAAGLVVKQLGTATVTCRELEHALSLRHATGSGILSEQELKQAVTVARNRGERIVMTNGCFDILHAGHVHYLAQARQLGDRLIVAVNSDASVRRLKGEQRPIHSLAERLQVVAALSAVDWVVLFDEETPERLIAEILPDVLVKGSDYTVEEIAGSQAVQQAGGDVQVLDFLPGCSTTSVITQLAYRSNSS